MPQPAILAEQCLLMALSLAQNSSTGPKTLYHQPTDLIGFDDLGRQLAHLLENIVGTKEICYVHPRPVPNVPYLHEDFDFILPKSEYMFVTCPSTPENLAFFNDLSRLNQHCKVIIASDGFESVIAKMLKMVAAGKLGGLAFFSDNPERQHAGNIFTLPKSIATDPTLDYYNSNAEAFAKRTLDIPRLRKLQDLFLSYLQPNSLILDFGCGAGRDAKYFLSQGFAVEALDGSPELCKIASHHTGIDVACVDFKDFSAEAQYDAIWAEASILHLPLSELPDMFTRVYLALKPNGIFYASFKYGNFNGLRHGRHFTDLTELTARDLVAHHTNFQILKIWSTEDARPDRSGERWLNMLLEKS